ncbi:unnamed protein product [Camellia sinensis]
MLKNGVYAEQCHKISNRDRKKKQRPGVCSSSAIKSSKGTCPPDYVFCLLPKPLGFAALHGPHQTPLLLLTSSLSAFVFDFQPQDPENIYVALAALSGRKIPGVILTRKLTKPPARKCWFVGYSRVDAIDATYKFNGNWDTGLRIGHHDCRNYTNELVEYLTGEKYVLEHLRRKQDSWSIISTRRSKKKVNFTLNSENSILEIDIKLQNGMPPSMLATDGIKNLFAGTP